MSTTQPTHFLLASICLLLAARFGASHTLTDTILIASDQPSSSQGKGPSLPGTNTFETLLQPPNSQSFRELAAATVLVDPDLGESYALVFGGASALGVSAFYDTWKYNFTSHIWTQLIFTTPFPSARFATAYLPFVGGQSLFMFGGLAGSFLGISPLY